MFFVGQSFASDLLPCKPKVHTSSQSMHDSKHNVQLASISDDMQADMAAMDCCNQDCTCPVGACVTLALMNSFTGELLYSTPTRALLVLTAIPDPFHPNLNKPPING